MLHTTRKTLCSTRYPAGSSGPNCVSARPTGPTARERRRQQHSSPAAVGFGLSQLLLFLLLGSAGGASTGASRDAVESSGPTVEDAAHPIVRSERPACARGAVLEAAAKVPHNAALTTDSGQYRTELN